MEKVKKISKFISYPKFKDIFKNSYVEYSPYHTNINDVILEFSIEGWLDEHGGFKFRAKGKDGRIYALCRKSIMNKWSEQEERRIWNEFRNDVLDILTKKVDRYIKSGSILDMYRG